MTIHEQDRQGYKVHTAALQKNSKRNTMRA